MINKKLIRKWVTALRSRRYKQGRGTLRRHGNTKKCVDRFCVLGVLCDLVDKKGWNIPDTWHSNEIINYELDGDKRNSYLPRVIKDKIGIGIDERYISVMNDEGCEFNQIANYLERKYL